MKRLLYLSGFLLLAVSGLFTVLGFLAEYAFFFDMVSHFRWQYAWGATVCLATFAILREKRLLLLASVVLMINVFPIVSYYIPNDAPSTTMSGASTKVLLMNVLSSNTDATAVRAQIERFQPDLVVSDTTARFKR